MCTVVRSHCHEMCVHNMGCGVGSQHEGYCDSMECLDLQLDEEVMSRKIVWELYFHSLSPSCAGVLYVYTKLKEPHFSHSCHLHSGMASTLATTSPLSFLTLRQKQQEKYCTAIFNVHAMIFFIIYRSVV